MQRSFPAAELEAAAGSAPVVTRRVQSRGYGTSSAHWCVEFVDGRRAFVKVALDENAEEWFRGEYLVYSRVRAPFLPELLAWHDGEVTLLAIADLSDAYPLLSTGLCSQTWLDGALPVLLETGRTCPIEGDAFLHLDVRSDNLCVRDGQAVFVDWNFAHVGNPLLDLVAWLPSLRLEGGPEPWELVPDSGGLAVLLAGFFAARAGLPPRPTAPTVREFQRAQAEVALPWAARELGLPQP